MFWTYFNVSRSTTVLPLYALGLYCYLYACNESSTMVFILIRNWKGGLAETRSVYFLGLQLVLKI